MKNAQRGSTWVWVVVIIVVVVIVAMSIQGFVLMGNNQKTQVPQDQNAVSTPTAASPVTTALYSYTLPSGWSSIPNSSVEGIQQAINKSTGDNFSIITNTLPPTLAKATSITQIVNQTDIGKVALSNFTDAKIDNVSTGSLNGKVAYIVKLSRTVTTTAGSQAQSIVQYSAINNGTTYSLIFMTTTTRVDKAQPDFQSIINSFQFK